MTKDPPVLQLPCTMWRWKRQEKVTTYTFQLGMRKISAVTIMESLESNHVPKGLNEREVPDLQYDDGKIYSTI